MIIEHLFDPFHAFQEINRCLSKTGAGYVNLPLVTGIRNTVRLLFGHVPETSVAYTHWFRRKEWDGNHLHYFSMRSIFDLARSCGLRLTSIAAVVEFRGVLADSSGCACFSGLGSPDNGEASPFPVMSASVRCSHLPHRSYDSSEV
jgi:hypothetical protein